MRCIVFCDGEWWKELFPDHLEVLLNPDLQNEIRAEDVLFDLREDAWDLPLYERFQGPVFIHSVTQTLAEKKAPDHWIRLNAWPGMLGRPALEAAAHPQVRHQAEEVAAVLGKKMIWVDDIPGLVTPRTLVMIINEAACALEEGVSNQDSIDIAMKLGTNYPKGPFEWAEAIGWQRISKLQQVLAANDPIYQPANSIPV